MKFKSIFFQFFSISNFFLNIFSVFIFLFFGYHDIAAQGFVAISVSNIFTYGFSGNIRNIYLGSKNIFSLKKVILFRLLISLIALLSSSIVIYFFISKANFAILFCIVFLTVTSFIFELLIARTEKIDLPNKYHAVNIVVFFIIAFFLIYSDLLKIFTILVFTHIFLNFIFFRAFFKNLFVQEIKIILNIRKNINLGIYSTFLKTFSNLVWRYSAFILLGNSTSAILFMAFSLGSFFGTLFDISYGALFLKRLKKSINLFLNTMFFLYFVLVSFLILIFKNFSSLSASEFKFFYTATFISLLGSYIIMYALKLRQNLFEIKEMQNICFKYDNIVYTLNALIIPLLYVLGSQFVVMAYLISSFYFYLIYRFLVLNVYKKRYKY